MSNVVCPEFAARSYYVEPPMPNANCLGRCMSGPCMKDVCKLHKALATGAASRAHALRVATKLSARYKDPRFWLKRAYKKWDSRNHGL